MSIIIEDGFCIENPAHTRRIHFGFPATHILAQQRLRFTLYRVLIWVLLAYDCFVLP